MNAYTRIPTRDGEDRAVALPVPGGHLVAVADGAGGTGNGGATADRLVNFLEKLRPRAERIDWFKALVAFDEQRLPGQTTGVVAFVTDERIVGAAVGDSSAWLVFPDGTMEDLTAHQRRKPLLGTGESLPVSFECERRGARLLLASDGLTKYAPTQELCQLAAGGAPGAAADALVNAVRLPTGKFQDDVAVVLVA